MLNFIKNLFCKKEEEVVDVFADPKVRKVAVWYPDAIRAVVYENVVDIFLYTNHNMIKITEVGNIKTYINLDKVQTFIVSDEE